MIEIVSSITRERGAWWMDLGATHAPQIEFGLRIFGRFKLDQFWFNVRWRSVYLHHFTDCEPSCKVVPTGFHLPGCLKFTSLMIRPSSAYERGACLRSELSLRSEFKLTTSLCDSWFYGVGASDVVLCLCYLRISRSRIFSFGCWPQCFGHAVDVVLLLLSFMLKHCVVFPYFHG
ncbi:hypothetical protein GQ457_12G019740 [Hibiscus cannabinus]